MLSVQFEIAIYENKGKWKSALMIGKIGSRTQHDSQGRRAKKSTAALFRGVYQPANQQNPADTK